MAKLKPILTLISVLIISLAVGYALAAWQEPEQIPPEDNVSAPINVGSETQEKEGSIAAGGFLGQVPGYGLYPDPGGASKTGSSLEITGPSSYLKLPLLTTTQRDALSPATGMMIYNATANEVQVYVPPAWKKLASGEPVGNVCTLPGDCVSTFCVDGYCCDSACTGSVCQTCGLLSHLGAGYCGYVTGTTNDPDNECAQGTTASDGCASNYCSGSSAACGVQSSGDGGCPVCQKCADSDIACEYYAVNTGDTGCDNAAGTCYRCDGSGVCVNQLSTQDLWSECDTTGCGTGNCKGSGYTCGYYTSAQRNCPICNACNASGDCTGQTTACKAGTYGCSGVDGKCDSGTCKTCIVYLRPNAAGDETSIAGISQPPWDDPHWTQVDEETSDGNTSNVEEYRTSYYRDLYNLNNTTQAGTINWIKVWIVGGWGNKGYGKTAIKTGGIVYDGSENDLPSGWNSYSTQYITNPQTGGSWTWAQLNALQAGVSLKGENPSYCGCTQVYVEVEFIPQ